MYNPEKCLNLTGRTVRDLIAILQQLPQNATVLSCGDDYVWIHVESDGSVVNIDNEDLEACYE